MRLAYSVRKHMSDAHVAELARTKPKKERARRPGVTRFTTDYCIRYCRSRGWALVDRESFDVRTKRHHDCMLGSDAVFDDGDGFIAVQGAGKGERKTHRERFERLGGVEKCARRHIRFIYLEFERRSWDPIKEETWA